MIYYVRKINSTKWNSQLSGQDAGVEALGLDLFARDMKADKRDISLWRMGDGNASESDIKLVLGLFGQKLCKFDYLLIPENKLAGFEIESSTADALTPVHGMAQYHSNIINVNFGKFKAFLDVVAELVIKPEHIHMATEAEVAGLFDTALKQNRIDFSKLDTTLHISLAKNSKISAKVSNPCCPSTHTTCRLCQYHSFCLKGQIVSAS